jgi:hypothetical protein
VFSLSCPSGQDAPGRAGTDRPSRRRRSKPKREKGPQASKDRGIAFGKRLAIVLSNPLAMVLVPKKILGRGKPPTKVTPLWRNLGFPKFRGARKKCQGFFVPLSK